VTREEAVEYCGRWVHYCNPVTRVVESSGVISHVTEDGMAQVHYAETTHPLPTHPANLSLDRSRR